MSLDIFNIRKNFNKEVLDATYKAQRKYGFNIGTGEHATWNNDADAFKHAYMQWKLAMKIGEKGSQMLGDIHEKETPNAPISERNMDLWNNAIGREIAHEMKQEYGKDWDLLGEEWASDLASKRIVEKMRAGDLIVNPNDKRRFENMELERLSEKDRVYSENEYNNFDNKYKALIFDNYLDSILDNNWKSYSNKELNKKVADGELIYIDNYTKSDGTRMKGYYKRKPIR